MVAEHSANCPKSNMLKTERDGQIGPKPAWLREKVKSDIKCNQLKK